MSINRLKKKVARKKLFSPYLIHSKSIVLPICVMKMLDKRSTPTLKYLRNNKNANNLKKRKKVQAAFCSPIISENKY
jgi:hypothetical protein